MFPDVLTNRSPLGSSRTKICTSNDSRKFNLHKTSTQRRSHRSVCVLLIIHNILHVASARKKKKKRRRISLNKYSSDDVVWCHWHEIIDAVIFFLAASSRDVNSHRCIKESPNSAIRLYDGFSCRIVYNMRWWSEFFFVGLAILFEQKKRGKLPTLLRRLLASTQHSSGNAKSFGGDKINRQQRLMNFT